MKDHRAFGTGLDSSLVGPIRRRLKLFYQQFLQAPAGGARVLFIVGCQRSGTTLLQDLLDRDWATRVYPERSPLTSDDRTHRIRLNSLPRLRDEVARQSAHVIAIKALVETQRTEELLAAIPGSRAIFLYRHYIDVVNSDLKIFGPDNGLRNIEPIAQATPDNWRSELVPESIRREIVRFMSQGISPQDAAALFWWARNSWYFQLGLECRRDVMLCRYEDLVADPTSEIDRIYKSLAANRHDALRSTNIRPRRLTAEKRTPLAPAIAGLCNELLERLDTARMRAETSVRADWK